MATGGGGWCRVVACSVIESQEMTRKEVVFPYMPDMVRQGERWTSKVEPFTDFQEKGYRYDAHLVYL